MTVSAGALNAGLTAAQSVIAAAKAKLGSLSLDEQAAVDVLDFAALFDPALVPLAAATPAIEFVVDWIAANNRSDEPGSEMRIDYGRRGSDPNLPTGEPAS